MGQITKHFFVICVTLTPIVEWLQIVRLLELPDTN